MRRELLGRTGQRGLGGNDVATANIKLIVNSERNRVPGRRTLEVMVHFDDARDPRGLARGQHDHAIAGSAPSHSTMVPQ